MADQLKKFHISKRASGEQRLGITGLGVSGFKSLVAETKVDIRRLTLLAGANSSGKTSMMQPLLLLKQTLEAAYDPGALLIEGPNVSFNDADQFLTRIGGPHETKQMNIKIDIDRKFSTNLFFEKQSNTPIDLVRSIFSGEDDNYNLTKNMNRRQMVKNIPGYNKFIEFFADNKPKSIEIRLQRDRCFFEI